MIVLVSNFDIVKVFLWRLILQNLELLCEGLGNDTLESAQVLASLEIDASATGREV